MTFTHASLFAGIGGFDLAAHWAGGTTTWYSEIEPYACKVMAKNFPTATNLGDITKISHPPKVDVLTGGFPCQDISLAGKGAGLAGTRSGLWFHYRRLIDEIRPRWVIAENVAALRTRGLDTVLANLAEIGYDAEWHCIPASAVGAPHRRDRIWIIARPTGWFPDPICTDMANADGGNDQRRPGEGRYLRPAEDQQGPDDHARGSGEDVADPASDGWEERPGEDRQQNAGSCRPGGLDVVREGAALADAASDLRGAPRDAGRESPDWGCPSSGSSYWAVEPDVGRVAHGVPARVDRLRCLGNAIVPQVALYLFRQIMRAEAEAAAEFQKLLA